MWIPDAVREELNRLPIPAARDSIGQALQAGWMRSRALQNVPLAAILANELDQGEAEAIALAIEMKADLLLIDEREGRIVARRAGLPVTGVLGVLLRAKAAGKISSVGAEIAALRHRAGFFIAPRLEMEILRAAGE